MDKTQKLLYQREIEKYLEGKRVYEIFQELMKSLVISKPADPLDFMIDKLSQPQQKKVFIVGPPGSNVREISLQLADYLGFTCTSVGDLLNKEVSKKTEVGKKIEDYQKQLKYVPDDIVIDLVKKYLATLEKERKSCIIEGFPKTKVQGLNLQRAGIIPDTFLLLNLPEDKITQCILKKIQGGDKWGQIANKQKAAEDYTLEYKMNIEHIKEIYTHHILHIDAENTEEKLLEEIVRLVKYKIKSKAPKRAARIIVLGAPGTNRGSLASLIAQKYGLVYVSTSRLLSDQVAKNTEIGRMCLETLKKGDLVPDDVMFSLVTNRLKQPDCQIHGYVLEGFPKTASQVQLLDDLKIQPTVIAVLEKTEEGSRDSALHRRFDPLTGETYDMSSPNLKLPQEVISRLTKRPQDEEKNIEKRINRWNENLKVVEQRHTSSIFKVNANVGEKNALETIAFYLENS